MDVWSPVVSVGPNRKAGPVKMFTHKEHQKLTFWPIIHTWPIRS
jgi:hypothetical protein